MTRFALATLAASALFALPLRAGPPYVTDDPAPTEYTHVEHYLFASGATARDGSSGSVGIDLNFGAAPDLQLTAALPVALRAAPGETLASGLGNIELAAKFRFLHAADVGLDVAVFPRVFLPAGSAAVGERRSSLLLPLWFGRSDGRWSTFGGGGCALHRGGDAKDYCLFGWAVTAQLTPAVQLGGELYHQTADTRGGDPSSGARLGIVVDLGTHLHLLASAGPGLHHHATTDQATAYAALLLTY